VFSERFGGAPLPPRAAAPDAAALAAPGAAAGPAISPEPGGTVTILRGNIRVSVPRRENETLLESARRAGLAPPFSCEAGNCATCMATLVDGEVKMRVNDVLTEEEVAEGYILTCQGVPQTPSVKIRYE
jgi:ferredoxin